MTNNRAKYFENKYKLFIRVWQTSDSINEVRVRLRDEHEWRTDMESHYHHSYLHKSTVQAYAYRLRKKGIRLNKLPLRLKEVKLKHHRVNYSNLNEYAQCF
jgi:hypothetical protein